MKWWERPLWSLDLETTGADPHSCQIVEWALLRVAPTGKVLEAHGGSTNVDVPPDAQAVHGIGNDTTRWGGSEFGALTEVLTGFRVAEACGEPLVVFNAAFDLTIVAATAREFAEHATFHRLRVIDPLVIDRHCDRYRRGSRKLEAVCRQYGVAPAAWHSAQADALAAAHLAYAIGRHHHELHALTLDELHAAQVEWASEWAARLQTHYRRNGRPDAVVDGTWPIRETPQEVTA